MSRAARSNISINTSNGREDGQQSQPAQKVRHTVPWIPLSRDVLSSKMPTDHEHLLNDSQQASVSTEIRMRLRCAAQTHLPHAYWSQRFTRSVLANSDREHAAFFSRISAAWCLGCGCCEEGRQGGRRAKRISRLRKQ